MTRCKKCGKTVRKEFKLCTIGDSPGFDFCEKTEKTTLKSNGWIDGKDAYLNAFIVIPQRQGLGTKYYKELEDHFKRNGVRRVWLEAIPEAIGFWENMEFRYDEEEELFVKEL